MNLTKKEFDLLVLFVQNKGIALFRENIYERVWESEYTGDSRTVDLHVQRLRRKIGWKDKIKPVYKVGYGWSCRERGEAWHEIFLENIYQHLSCRPPVLRGGGYFLVSTSFYSGLQRELANAQEENRMLQTLLAIQLGNTEEEGGADRPSMVQGGMDAVEGQMGGTLIRCRVSMPGDGILYENVRFLGIGGQDGKELAESLAEDEIGCRVGKFQDSYLIQCAAYLLFEEEPVLVETFRDVSQLFLERREQFSIFRSLVYVWGR